MKAPTWMRHSFAVQAALAVVVVALLLTSAVAWWQARDEWDDRAAAVAADEADRIFTLDHRTAKDDVDRVLDLATGKFGAGYGSQRSRVISEAVDQRLVSTAHVPDDAVAVEYFAGDRAQILVAVNVTASHGGGKPEEKRTRLRVTTVKAGDTWLVSEIEEIR